MTDLRKSEVELTAAKTKLQDGLAAAITKAEKFKHEAESFREANMDLEHKIQKKSDDLVCFGNLSIRVFEHFARQVLMHNNIFANANVFVRPNPN